MKKIREHIKHPLKRRQALSGYLFISPWIIGFLVFGLYPIIMSLYYSLSQYDVLRIPQFIGLRNYSDLLLNDNYFWGSIWNTLFFTVVRVPLVIIGSLLLAVLVNNAIKGVKIFRTIYFIPSIITGVILSSLWLWILNPQYGLINSILSYIGIDGPLWLNDPNWSKPSLIMMSLWSIGGGRMLVFLAALQSVPQHLYESVELEGGNWWHKFKHITLPLISPIIFLWSILEVIVSMQVFIEAYIMTKGGPLNSTLFYSLYLYNKAFDDFEMGYASAMAWILFVITMIITLIMFKGSKRWVYYEGEGAK